MLPGQPRPSIQLASNRLFALTVCLFATMGCSSSSQPGKSKHQKAETKKSATKSASPKQKANNNHSKKATKPTAVSKSTAQSITADELNQGWLSLFDGKTLFGWKPAKPANWRVENGTIAVDQGKVGLLCTTTQFADYELRLEFKSDKGTNSGIFLHTPPVPTNPAEDCYELNIADQDNPFPTGSLVRRQKVVGPHDKTDWQEFAVTLQGAQVTVKLDGKQVLQYSDKKPLRRGFIGLQHNKGRVAFRNIRIRPLGTKSIFNGKDLNGWKQYPKMKSRFSVTKEGWMNVKDGSGQLETTKSYADFVLQLQCITHAKDLNSGIFFRCIPGAVMMGYESQIHNGYKEGDRTNPIDYGTGGIFRRTKARSVVADDEQWFHKTLIADGRHMAAWVNGVQVSDWTDPRAANENPRRGSRTDAGTIMIQGHDPTTDISFRGLKIVEMPNRTVTKP